MSNEQRTTGKKEPSLRISSSLIRFLLITAVLLPFIPLVMWAFSFRWFFPALLPEAWSLRAWETLFSPQVRVGWAMFNSTLIATAVTLISILIGIPAGRAMGLHSFRGKALVEFLILAPTIMPVLAVALGMHVVFIRYGLADTYLGVILVHLVPVTPYMVLIMSSVFSNYNVDYEAQARSLGARPWQVLRHITLPTIFPGLMVGALFSFIISWSQYLLTLLIGGGRILTLPILLFSTAAGGNNALTAALSLLFIAPAVAFLLLTTRYLTSGDAALGGFGKL